MGFKLMAQPATGNRRLRGAARFAALSPPSSQPIRDAIATAGPTHQRLKPTGENDLIVECFRPAA
ncbi:unnamed protein product, partial [Nesidiocoris tenuis]